MTTILVDDDEIRYSWTPRDPNFIPPTNRELVAEKFSPEADCYVCGGRPYMVFAMWDYAEDWSQYPFRKCTRTIRSCTEGKSPHQLIYTDTFKRFADNVSDYCVLAVKAVHRRVFPACCSQ